MQNLTPFPLLIALQHGLYPSAVSGMCDPTAAESSSTEENDLLTFMNLQHECKIVALRAYTKHSYMFPEGLLQLSSPDRAMANAPVHLRIEALRLQIEFLKSLHDTPISGPGVLQMDGASHGDDKPGGASRNITSQSPAGSAAAPAAAAAPSQGRMLQQKGRQSNHGSVRRRKRLPSATAERH